MPSLCSPVAGETWPETLVQAGGRGLEGALWLCQPSPLHFLSTALREVLGTQRWIPCCPYPGGSVAKEKNVEGEIPRCLSFTV